MHMLCYTHAAPAASLNTDRYIVDRTRIEGTDDVLKSRTSEMYVQVSSSSHPFQMLFIHQHEINFNTYAC